MIGHSLTALLLVLPAVAAAQVVPVRTGEHDGYTRVVLDFERLPEWEVTSGERRISLETDTRLSFDLSEVYRRIGEDRIDRLVQPSPGALDILLNCDCAARTFELRNEGLVIDVRPGPPEPAPAAAEPVRDRHRERSRPPAGMPLRDGLLPGLLTRTVRPDPPVETEPQPRTEIATAGTQGSPESSEPSDPSADAAALDRAVALRRSIIKAMARSAEEGLVELSSDLPTPEAEKTPLETPRRAPVPPDFAPGSNILVETQAERDRRGHSAIPPDATCPDGLSGGRSDWLAAIGPLDLDAPEPEQARAEAIRLIAGGFGAEARVLLASHRSDDAEMALLDELARVADGPAPAPHARSVADCGPLLTLFVLIADPPSGPRRIATVREALAGLDPALRIQFGRRAIAALEALGRREDAEIVRGSVARQSPGLPESALSPRNFEPGGAIPTEEEAIRELADRTPEASDALRALIDSRRRSGETVPSTIIDQAAALLPELDPEDRAALSRSVIRAEIAQASYLSAARRIDGLAGREPELARSLDVDLHEALVGIVDDGVFLQQAARFAGDLAPEPQQRLAMAERIRALHVPQLARRFLAEDGAATSSERLLRARIDIGLEDWEDAGAALAGLDGAEAEALRGEIAAGRAPVGTIASAEPAPSGVGAESLSLIARSAALREKYRTLLASGE